jgi:transcription elongation factor Elf1
MGFLRPKKSNVVFEGKFNTPYNNQPVETCMNCNSLHIVEEGDDIVCKSCGSKNYTEIINIYKWIDVQKDKRS